MRIELVVLVIAGLAMANVYTDGKLLTKALSYKKYYQMGGIAVGALFVLWLFRKHPQKAHQLMASSDEYLKYLPLDRTSTSVLSPILDFTSKFSGPVPAEMAQVRVGHDGGMAVTDTYPLVDLGQVGAASSLSLSSSSYAKPQTKRSVSETKKKWVAANQNWRCGHCGKQLPPWFEVDHKIRLEHGGSNHVDNLVALCRDCHGQKTAIENL